MSSRLTGNYIDPADFPFVERRNPAFTLGRLSRADIEKYPLDFPVFYEDLDLPEARFRVMAWNGELDKQYRWHRFGPQWELLPANRELAARFLESLNVFLYPLGHRVKESWGRAVVEAMLTGAVPVVPVGHHFEKLITHGESGFVCREYREYHDVVRRGRGAGFRGAVAVLRCRTASTGSDVRVAGTGHRMAFGGLVDAQALERRGAIPRETGLGVPAAGRVIRHGRIRDSPMCVRQRDRAAGMDQGRSLSLAS